jgi:hypothetical protein
MKMFFKWFGICFISLAILFVFVSVISPSFGYWIFYVLYMSPIGEVKVYFFGWTKWEGSVFDLIILLVIPHAIYSCLLSSIIYVLNVFKNMES